MQQHTPKRGVKARRRYLRESGGALEASGKGNSAPVAMPLLPALALPATRSGQIERVGGALNEGEVLLAAPVKDPAADEQEPDAGAGWRHLLPQLQKTGSRFLTQLQDRIRALTLENWFWIGVIVLATILRFWGLGDKPLHHDESMHAYFSLAFAQDPASYRYDPLLHGPFQFHAEGFMFALLLGLQTIFVHGVSGNPWINDTTARIVPALFGIGIVILPLGLRRELGRWGALAAAFLLAVSPTFVYFSRFLREDIYFNFFMFAMVVSAVRFAHRRELRWFLALVASAVLAYATFEGIYLTLAIFGSFLAILATFEVAYFLARRLPSVLTLRERLFFSRACLLAALGAFGGILAIILLKIVDNLSTYINTHTNSSSTGIADMQVQNLENVSVAVLLYGSIFIALLVIGTLLWRMYYEDVRTQIRVRSAGVDLTPDEEEEFSVEESDPALDRIERIDRILTSPSRWVRGVRGRLDPDRQRLLWTLFSINWIYLFVGFVVAWVIFAILYWTIPGAGGYVSTLPEGFQQGIGRGIWQGLYYWIEQQNVDRGGQPVYYYLILIPLYEQLAVVFGLAGCVYSLIRPTRFRLFLVWWFVVSLFLYSWAGEKMPWLSIHILLPLMLLAGMTLGRVLQGTVAFVRQYWERLHSPAVELDLSHGPGRAAVPWWQRSYVSILATVAAALLLIPMINSMLILSHQDAADGPHEMMVYVQTTEDVDSVMNYINHADQVLYHGQHKLRIAVGAGEEWPFYWYLRDYPNTYFDYPSGNADYVRAHPVDVLLLYPAGDPNGADAATFMSQHPTGYTQQGYKLRSWWDEGYKPQPPANPQPSQFLLYGDGFGNWLVYGKAMPVGTKINWLTGAPTAFGRVWNWVWHRQALGDVNGSYDFVMIVRSGMPTPLPPPLVEKSTP